MTFKPGDRVAVYNNGDRFVATVEYITCGLLGIVGDSMGVLWHPKQCRRLKPKKRREFWIAQHQCSRPTVHAQKMEDMICGSGCKIEWIRVREVIDAQKVTKE